MTENRFLIELLDRNRWDRAAAEFKDLSYLQCGSYSAWAARNVSSDSEFIAFKQGNALVGLSNVRIRRIGALPFGIAYVNGGPLTDSDESLSPERFRGCLKALYEEYVARRHLILRVVPPANGGMNLKTIQDCLEAERFFPNANRASPEETFILDLDQSLDELRKNLNPKWRSDLLKAEKNDLKITRSSSLADFDRFEPLYLELAARKGFRAVHDASFFRRVQSTSQPYEELCVHLAWHGGEVVAGHVGSFVGNTAVHLLGASNVKGREQRASHLLQLAAITHAKSQGNRFYDLGGINEVENPNVFTFKKRMNGRRVTSLGSYQIASHRIAASIFGVIENAHRTLSKLRTR